MQHQPVSLSLAVFLRHCLVFLQTTSPAGAFFPMWKWGHPTWAASNVLRWAARAFWWQPHARTCPCAGGCYWCRQQSQGTLGRRPLRTEQPQLAPLFPRGIKVWAVSSNVQQNEMSLLVKLPLPGSPCWSPFEILSSAAAPLVVPGDLQVWSTGTSSSSCAGSEHPWWQWGTNLAWLSSWDRMFSMATTRWACLSQLWAAREL